MTVSVITLHWPDFHGDPEQELFMVTTSRETAEQIVEWVTLYGVWEWWRASRLNERKELVWTPLTHTLEHPPGQFNLHIEEVVVVP